MSGVSSPPSPSAIVATGGHVDALLALAAFVQKPEYAERVKELQAAEAAALAAEAKANAAIAACLNVAEETTKAEGELASHQAAWDEYSARDKEKLTERENSVAARESAVSERERAIVATSYQSVTAAVERGQELDARESRQDQREKELSKREAELAATSADLQRRLAKIREAGL